MEAIGLWVAGVGVFSDPSSHSVWTPVETDIAGDCIQERSNCPFSFDTLIHGSIDSLAVLPGPALWCTISTPLSDTAILAGADDFLCGYGEWLKLAE